MFASTFPLSMLAAALLGGVNAAFPNATNSTTNATIPMDVPDPVRI